MKKISVIPFAERDLNNNFFDENTIYNFPFYVKKTIEGKGMGVSTYDLISVEEADYFIFFDLNLSLLWKTYLNNKLNCAIFIPFEPSVVVSLHSKKNLNKLSNLFNKILTWNDSLCINDKFIKFEFPMSHCHAEKVKEFPFKKFLTNISGYKLSNAKNELYSKRIEAIQYFEKHLQDNFDLYGMGWSQDKFPSYRGSVENKYDILKQYKFSLCYENMYVPGGISEKIFDCFYAKCIPIYWGASNVEAYIPKACYIDKREFASYSKLVEYLRSMTEDEYNDRVKAIEQYLVSDQFKCFSPEYFADTVYKALMEINIRDYSKLRATISLAYLSLYKASEYVESFFKRGYKKIKRFF